MAINPAAIKRATARGQKMLHGPYCGKTYGDCPKVVSSGPADEGHVRHWHKEPCVCRHPRDRHNGVGGCCTKTVWHDRDGKTTDREQFCGCTAFRLEAERGP